MHSISHNIQADQRTLEALPHRGTREVEKKHQYHWRCRQHHPDYSTFHNKSPPGGGAREKQNPPPGVRGGYCPTSNVLEKAAPGVSRVTDQKDPLGQGRE